MNKVRKAMNQRNSRKKMVPVKIQPIKVDYNIMIKRQRHGRLNARAFAFQRSETSNEKNHFVAD